MGIDAPTARYLLMCRAAGVRFGNVLTLGRQSLHFGPVHLVDSAKDLGLEFSTAEVVAVFAEPGRKCEQFFRLLGAESVASVDASDYEGATHIADLNKSFHNRSDPCHLGLQSYDFIFDGGTLEHVFHFPNAIENVMRLAAPYAHFLSVTVANNFLGHGFYQFSPELFFRVFSEDRGFECLGSYLYEECRAPNFIWMKIEDPVVAQSRVLLTNTRPTYMAFHARRIGEFEGFTSWPQQSDYSVLWTKQEAPVVEGNSDVSRAKMARRRLKALWRSLQKPIRDPIEGLALGMGTRAYDRRHYTPVALDLALSTELNRRLNAAVG